MLPFPLFVFINLLAALKETGFLRAAGGSLWKLGSPQQMNCCVCCALEPSATSCLMVAAAHSSLSLVLNFSKVVCSGVTVQEWPESGVLVLMLYSVVRLQCTI